MPTRSVAVLMKSQHECLLSVLSELARQGEARARLALLEPISHSHDASLTSSRQASGNGQTQRTGERREKSDVRRQSQNSCQMNDWKQSTYSCGSRPPLCLPSSRALPTKAWAPGLISAQGSPSTPCNGRRPIDRLRSVLSENSAHRIRMASSGREKRVMRPRTRINHNREREAHNENAVRRGSCAGCRVAAININRMVHSCLPKYKSLAVRTMRIAVILFFNPSVCMLREKTSWARSQQALVTPQITVPYMDSKMV